MCKAKVQSRKFWQHTVMAWFFFFFLMGDGVVLKNWVFHGGWLEGGGSIDWKKLLGFFLGGIG